MICPLDGGTVGSRYSPPAISAGSVSVMVGFVFPAGGGVGVTDIRGGR